jgi:hypothetical protein
MSDSREKFEKWIDNSRYALAAPSRKEAMFQSWQAAIAQQPSAVVPEGLALVPAIATREIEDAIGRNRNLKASEIWEVAVSVASKNVQQPSAVVPECAACVSPAPHYETQRGLSCKNDTQSTVVPSGVWQFYQDGEWHTGMNNIRHRADTEAAGYKVRDLWVNQEQDPLN